MIANVLIAAVGFVAAAYVLWSPLEYVLHRFAFHQARGKNYGSREHLSHHARRDYDVFENWEAWVGVVLWGPRCSCPAGFWPARSGVGPSAWGS
ncbi:MAG TPA: hypothetical protein VFU85_10135 [Nocardioides sp.]|nr:hypothetical protein [Nocardioides sp.]